MHCSRARLQPDTLRCTGRFLHNGDVRVSIDNNHIERLMHTSAMCRKAWFFTGSYLARQQATIVIILVQSAKFIGRS